MKVRSASKSIRHLARYQEILRVMVKFGFWEFVEKIRVGLIRNITKNIFPKLEQRKYAALGTPTRLRLAFEELGPTFVKLGQMLSIRPDLIPPKIAEELTKLQDEVEPVPFEKLKPSVEAEYGKPLLEVFSGFDETSLAAASIAQVHRAQLKSGDEVAVKILRPKIHKTIETDLEILLNLAELIEKHVPESKLYDPVGIVHEFSRTIEKEQNLVTEGRNIEIFRRHLQNDDTIKITKVYWDYTRETILVTEFIDGIKISDLDGIKKRHLDPKQLAYNGASAILKQIFELGVFHADPHPGNIFALSGNVIAPVDFGMVGRIDDEMKDYLLDLLLGVVDKDVYRISRVLLNIGIINEQINTRSLNRDLSDYLDRYYGIPLNQLDSGKLLNEFMELVRDYRIKLPSDLVMMGKAIVISESVGRHLYPQFNLFDLLVPYARKLLLSRFNPMHHYRNFNRLIYQVMDILKKFPTDAEIFLAKMRRDQITVRFQHQGLENFSRELDRSSNRVSFSLIVAALIIGSSIIIHMNKGPSIFGYPILGIFGYVLASILGLWLIIAIMRSGKL